VITRQLELELAQIQQDLVELLDNAGQKYTKVQMQIWAWELLLNRHPEFTPDAAWFG
jgi:hypothetical protein